MEAPLLVPSTPTQQGGYSSVDYNVLAPTSLGPMDLRYVSNMSIKEDIVEVNADDLYENTHWITENKLNLIITLVIVVFLVCVIVFLAQNIPVNSIQTIICLSLCGVGILLYMIESCCSSTRQYLWSVTDPEGIQYHIHRVRSSAPRLCFHVECYHYETYTTTTTDSQGKQTTSTRTEKHVTYRESQPFHYDCWDDISGDLIGVGELYRLTRVRFHKTYVFADEHTREAWEAEARNIQDRNRCRDTHMDFWHCLDIPSYVPRMLAVPGNEPELPRGVGKNWYILSSLLLCGYCYRSWFHSISTRQSYDYVKRIQRHCHHHM